jgi:hypothetical protein
MRIRATGRLHRLESVEKAQKSLSRTTNGDLGVSVSVVLAHKHELPRGRRASTPIREQTLGGTRGALTHLRAVV